MCSFCSIFGTPLPLRGGFPPNIQPRPAVHTQAITMYFFHACASIISLNNPILCEHNRLIYP